VEAFDKPSCFGDLDRVFPMGQDGLRAVPDDCFLCNLRVLCLKTALDSPKGLEIKEEKIIQSDDLTIVKRLRLWSLKKSAERERSSKKEQGTGAASFLLKDLPSVIITPWQYFQKALRTKSESFSFGLLWGAVGSMLGYFYQSLAIQLGFLDVGNILGPELSSKAVFFGLLFVLPLGVVLEILLVSGIWHIMLRLVGASKGGYSYTFRVVCLSQGAMIACILPLAGTYLAMLWKFWIQLVGLRYVHQTNYQRLILAIFLVAFCFLGLVVGLGFLGFYILSKVVAL
jgi:hypothetical protein